MPPVLPLVQVQCLRVIRGSRCPNTALVEDESDQLVCARCAPHYPSYRKAGVKARGILVGKKVFWLAPSGAFVFEAPRDRSVWPEQAKTDRRRREVRAILRGQPTVPRSIVSTDGTRATCVRCEGIVKLAVAREADGDRELLSLPFDVLCRFCAEDGLIVGDGNAAHLRGYQLFHRVGGLFVRSRNSGLNRRLRKLDQKYDRCFVKPHDSASH